jgi:hypothetical protein
MEEFEKYVSKFMPAPTGLTYKGVAALASAALVEAGIRIFEYYQKQQENQHKAIADELGRQLV